MSQPVAAKTYHFQGKGEAVRQMNEYDWLRSSLGRVSTWPRNLLFSAEILLQSDLPMFLFWGSQHLFFSNDAFQSRYGNNGFVVHGQGQPGKQLWNENWPLIEPLINAVIEGQSTSINESLIVSAHLPDPFKTANRVFHCHPIKNDEGRVQGVLAIGEAPAESRKEEASVESIEEELHFTLTACELGTWDLDTQTMQFRCNSKTKEIFGLHDEENIGLDTALAVIHPDDRQAVTEAIQKSLDFSSGGKYNVEYTVVHPSTGEHRVVKAKGRVFFDAEEKPERFTGTIQDVSDEKRSWRSREQLQQLVEHAADFMSMEAMNDTLTYINQAGRKLVGIDAEENLSLLSLNDFFPEEQYTVLKQEVLPALTKNGQWSGLLKIRHRPTGDVIPCYGNYVLVWDSSTGKAIARALTLRDLRPDLQARRELEESEKRFRNLVQEAPVATAIYVGREMKIQWANDAMIKLWGKDKTVIGKTVREALPEIEDQPFHGQLDRVFTTGEMYQATEDKGELMVEGSLQTFYFNFSYKPLRDADGQVYGILNMAIDVTDMVNNKRKLEESEKAFRNLIMQAPVGICLLTGDRFIVDIANEQYLELVGRKKEELINHPVWEALPEAKAQGYDLLLDSVKQTGKPYFGNEQAVELLRNGTIETVYLNFVYEPLFDDNGEVHSILVIAIDISQQVKLRQQIEHAEKRARLAVAAGNMGTYEANLLTGEVIGSPRFYELFSVEPNAHQSDLVSQLHPDDLPVRKIAHEQARKTGMLQYQCRIISGNEVDRWIQIYGQLYKDEQQRPHRLIGIVQDITIRKSTEQELEKRVQERTSELMQMNEELQQFTYISSHDLKEPLRKIQVFGSLAKELAAPDNSKLQTSLDKVVFSASRMSSLLNDLLHYTALSNTDRIFTSVDLNLVLKEVLDDAELLITEKHATIRTENLPVVQGISFQLTRLFFNLIQNALKFSKSDLPPVIDIRSSILNDTEKQNHALPVDTMFYKIEVADNGIGFKRELSQKIFVVFQRLHDKESYAGNGIGLALCKKIVENHKGKIMADSERNVGSVFTILLPQNLAG